MCYELEGEATGFSQREFTSAFLHSVLNEQVFSLSRLSVRRIHCGLLWHWISTPSIRKRQEELFLMLKFLKFLKRNINFGTKRRFLNTRGRKLIYWMVLCSLWICKVGFVCFLIVSIRCNMHTISQQSTLLLFFYLLEVCLF